LVVVGLGTPSQNKAPTIGTTPAMAIEIRPSLQKENGMRPAQIPLDKAELAALQKEKENRMRHVGDVFKIAVGVFVGLCFFALLSLALEPIAPGISSRHAITIEAK
jgi:hypothetical protein